MKQYARRCVAVAGLALSSLVAACGPVEEQAEARVVRQMTVNGMPAPQDALPVVSVPELSGAKPWPWTPGRVNWQWEILECGNGYRVRPEGGGIVCARAPSQEVDGIYNIYWGCNTALKVPNDCFADVYIDGTIYCNCPVYAGSCSWLNVSAEGWSPPC